jgi:hypothetical protein
VVHAIKRGKEMRHGIVLVALFLSACDMPVTTPTTDAAAPAALTQDTVMATTDPAALLALGAVQLDQAAFMAQVVDKPLVDTGGAWDWVINANGTHRSSSLIGDAWSDVGPWNWTNGQYCRRGADGTEFRCSDVYLIGNILRFSDTEKPETLATWGAKL